MVSFMLVLSLLSCQSAYRIKSLPKNPSLTDIYLKAMDRSSHSLSQLYSAHKGLVLIFWQPRCPCVTRYQARINDLYKLYHKEDIFFAHIFSNSDETFADAKREYQRRSIPLPLMKDKQGKFAKAIHAQGTPTAVLMDQTGHIIYMGWLDNERRPFEKGRIPYLEDAIVALINNKPIKTTTSPMFGCPIR
jgi:thioredoxin-related protein